MAALPTRRCGSAFPLGRQNLVSFMAKVGYVFTATAVAILLLLAACATGRPATNKAACTSEQMKPSLADSGTFVATSSSTITRTPSFPSGDASDFQYQESECLGITSQAGRCARGKAYESARELDALLLELDSQFTDGEWESALERVTIPQEHWESLKVPYCEYDVHLSIGGTGYAIFYWNCIERENRNRIGHLESFVCMLLEFKC